MVVTCDIQFENNPQGTFFVGQVATGKVTLTADKPKQVKAVSLKIIGFAHTRWVEKGTKNSSDTTFRGHVDYLNTFTYLLAPNASDSAIIIEAGIHTFGFACRIPINCPSSFEGYRGHIRYTIQVDLVRPWKFDQTFTKAFTVLTIKDLNYVSPLLKMPSTAEVSKVFCCGPFKSDPLQMHVQLPQTGYVPGQLIPVSILITNDTKTRIDEICVRLVMMIYLYSTFPRQKSKHETMVVAKLKGDPVLQHCKKHFNYLLPIPATPPTCSHLCSIIQIAYCVEVEAKIPGIMYANQCIQTPITIGNVPLQADGMVMQQQPMARQFNAESDIGTSNDVAVLSLAENNNDPGVSNMNTEPWLNSANLPAPVYMEATHMPQGKLNEDSAHDYGEKSFTPKYPVFNVPSPTALLPKGEYETNDPVVPPEASYSDKGTWL